MDKSFVNGLVEELNKNGQYVALIDDEKNAAISVDAKDIVKLMEELKSGQGFDLLFNVTAVDFPEHFFAVYTVVSTADDRQLLVKVQLPKDKPEIQSLTGVWKAANVQEREAYDLLGIIYTNHPNLTRILLPDDFEGYPLRKDYQMKDRV